MSASTTRPRARGILPTPAIGGLGVLEDAAQAVGIALGPGLELVLIGETKGWLGQSLWLREIAGREEGRRRRLISPPNAPTAISSARRSWPGSVRACHDVSDGGLLVAVAEMALAGQTGVPLLPEPRDVPSHEFWFGEDQARYMLAVADVGCVAASRRGGRGAGDADRQAGGEDLTLPDGDTISLAALRAAHERFFPAWMDGPADQGRDRMAMPANEIEALIKAALPDARVTVEDLAGDGDHYAASVVSEAFRGKSRVQQHQIVYAALRGRMGGELHALALQTSAPD